MKESTKLKIREEAFDSIGFYCAGTATPDGKVVRPRGPYQNGWNAALSAIIEAEHTFETWFNTLSNEQQNSLEFLLEKDIVSLSRENESEVCTSVRCSDMFFFACSDEEPVNPVDFQLLHYILETTGFDGVIAWIAIKRDLNPVVDCCSENWDDIKNSVKKIMEEQNV